MQSLNNKIVSSLYTRFEGPGINAIYRYKAFPIDSFTTKLVDGISCIIEYNFPFLPGDHLLQYV